LRKEQFIQYIENPLLLGDASLPELKAVVEAYPFFQTAHLLYAKALSNLNHVDYYSGLKKTSIIAGDRKVLYRLITTNRKADQKEEKVEEQKITAVEKKITQEIIPLQKKTEQNELPEIKLVSNIITHGKESENTIDYEAKELEREQQFRQKNIEGPAEKKEKTSRVELVVTSKEKEISQQENKLKNEGKISETPREKFVREQEVKDENVDDVVLNRVVNAYIEKEILEITEIDQPLKKETEEIPGGEIDVEEGKQILTETLNEPHSFSEWLKLLSASKKPVEKEDPALEKEELHPVKPEEKPVEKELPVLPEKDSKKDKIIEKIIHNEPSISKLKPTTEFFKPLEKAKESIKKDETLVTETLAWILEKQGKYVEAIRAYETLSLKYPEKSVYFASLISKIRIKQKQR
jgi:hypothetical protein